MRLAVYNDQAHWREDGHIYAARAFVLFLGELARSFDSLVVAGRLQPEAGSSHYRLPDEVAFAPLPGYGSSASPLGLARALAGSLTRFWRLLGAVDAVWVLGPHPLSIPFVVMAALRRKRVVLGVRQDFPAYARNRHPTRRWIQLAALALEHAFRALARRFPVATVGPDLARNYRAAPRLLAIAVSLVRERDVVGAKDARVRDRSDRLSILSVGRIDREKNPLLLADVLARLRERDDRWRLVVCGDGPLEGELAARLRQLGVSDAAELRGHVALDGGLRDLYRESDFFLHVSWTEGVPQVLFESFAAGLPVVATAVGGVEQAAEEAALLIPPGDEEAAAVALERLRDDEPLRAELVERGLAAARRHTMEAECRRLAAFIRGEPVPDAG